MWYLPEQENCEAADLSGDCSEKQAVSARDSHDDEKSGEKSMPLLADSFAVSPRRGTSKKMDVDMQEEGLQGHDESEQLKGTPRLRLHSAESKNFQLEFRSPNMEYL